MSSTLEPTELASAPAGVEDEELVEEGLVVGTPATAGRATKDPVATSNTQGSKDNRLGKPELGMEVGNSRPSKPRDRPWVPSPYTLQLRLGLGKSTRQSSVFFKKKKDSGF